MITKQKINRLIIIGVVMLVLAITCVFKSSLHPIFLNFFAKEFNLVSKRGNLLVHFINVGQADAAAINLPDGKILLIDTGSESNNVTYVNYLKDNVLNTERDKYIDYLVLSHADMDHIGGTIKLLKEFEVGTVFLPKLESDSQGYAEIKEYIESNCSYQFLGDEFVIANKNYEILFFEILVETDTNSSSQIIKLNSFGESFLFVGDIDSEDEKVYLNRYNEKLDCDVLKVSHHGSSSSTSQEFLATTTPNYAVISVGSNNYGHPNQEVINRLSSNKVRVLRTDLNGDVLFVNGDIYDMCQLNNGFYITRLSLDYTLLVLIINCSLIVIAVVIVFKKEKNKHLSK